MRLTELWSKFVRTFGFNPIVRLFVGPNYEVDRTMGLNPKVRTNFGVQPHSSVNCWTEL